MKAEKRYYKFCKYGFENDVVQFSETMEGHFIMAFEYADGSRKDWTQTVQDRRAGRDDSIAIYLFADRDDCIWWLRTGKLPDTDQYIIKKRSQNYQATMEQDKRYYTFLPENFNEEMQRELTALIGSYYVGCEFPKKKRTDLLDGIFKRLAGVPTVACYAFREKWDYLCWMEDGTLPASDVYERKVCELKPKEIS